MAHMHIIEDALGDVVDCQYFCSDTCHSRTVGTAYRGWNGCIELSYSQTCEADDCNEIVHGIEVEWWRISGRACGL